MTDYAKERELRAALEPEMDSIGRRSAAIGCWSGFVVSGIVSAVVTGGAAEEADGYWWLTLGVWSGVALVVYRVVLPVLVARAVNRHRRRA